MRLDFYCVGVCHDNGKPTQIAGCGVVIVFTDDHNRTKLRSFKYGLGNSTQNLADLQAVRLALASVKPAFRGGVSVLHTNSPYVMRMLERHGTGFASVSRKNNHEVLETRRWYSYYSDISVVMENPSDDKMAQAKDLAEIGLATQEHSDSGTLEGFEAAD